VPKNISFYRGRIFEHLGQTRSISLAKIKAVLVMKWAQAFVQKTGLRGGFVTQIGQA
jgi:hypothetical protein